jgi:hypothetical protein
MLSSQLSFWFYWTLSFKEFFWDETDITCTKGWICVAHVGLYFHLCFSSVDWSIPLRFAFLTQVLELLSATAAALAQLPSAAAPWGCLL